MGLRCGIGLKKPLWNEETKRWLRRPLFQWQNRQEAVIWVHFVYGKYRRRSLVLHLTFIRGAFFIKEEITGSSLFNGTNHYCFMAAQLTRRAQHTELSPLNFLSQKARDSSPLQAHHLAHMSLGGLSPGVAAQPLLWCISAQLLYSGSLGRGHTGQAELLGKRSC